MSMIIICQSNNDLNRYGLKNAYNVGMIHIRDILKKINFNGKVWSNDTFGCLYDESYNYIVSDAQNNNFSDTSVFYFLNELFNVCDKIAIFYCEPLSDISEWCLYNNAETFLTELENMMRKDNNYITLIYKN